MGCIVSRTRRRGESEKDNRAAITLFSITSTPEAALSRIAMTMHIRPVLSYPILPHSSTTDGFKYKTMQCFMLHICLDEVVPWIPDPRQLWMDWKHHRHHSASSSGQRMDWDVAALALETRGADVFEFLPLLLLLSSSSTSLHHHHHPSSPPPPNSYFLDRLSIRVYEKLLLHWTFQLFVAFVRHSSDNRNRHATNLLLSDCEQYPVLLSSNTSSSSSSSSSSPCFSSLGLLNVPDLLIHIGFYAGALTLSQLKLLQETVTQLESER